MDNFDLKKYLAEGKLLKEEIDVNKILSDGGYDIIDDEELLMTVKSRLKGKSNIDAEKLNLLVMKIEDEEGGNIDFTENKLLKENIDDLFGEYVAQWSQGNYDYDFAELKPGPVKGSLVDDFTLGPDDYDDDGYTRDYKMMRDYLSKNKSYKLSRDEKEGLSQFPVQFSLEDDGETIKADIYYSPEYLAMVDSDS